MAIALTFTNSDWHIPQPVTVTAVDDALCEGLHTSTITHTPASSDPNYNGIAITDVVVQVTDNDTAGVTIAESGGLTAVNEDGPTSDTYTVVLDSEPTATVAVTIAPDGQTDVGAGPGAAIVLRFTDSNWNRPQTVTVTAVVDAVPEGPHSSTITHGVASSDVDYDSITIPPLIVPVQDQTTVTEDAEAEGSSGGEAVDDMAPNPPSEDGPGATEESEPVDPEPPPPSADEEVVDRDMLEEALELFFGAPLCGHGSIVVFAFCLVGCCLVKREWFVRRHR